MDRTNILEKHYHCMMKVDPKTDQVVEADLWTVTDDGNGTKTIKRVDPWDFLRHFARFQQALKAREFIDCGLPDLPRKEGK